MRAAMQPYVAIAHRIRGHHAQKLPHLLRRRFVIALHTLGDNFRRRRHLVGLAPAIEGEGRTVIAEQVRVQCLEKSESLETTRCSIGPCGSRSTCAPFCSEGNGCGQQQASSTAGQNVSDSPGHIAIPNLLREADFAGAASVPQGTETSEESARLSPPGRLAIHRGLEHPPLHTVGY